MRHTGLLLLALMLSVLAARGQEASPSPGGDEHWDPQFDEQGLEGPVIATAAAIDGSVYAGGAFTLAGTTPVSNLARWDGEQWHDIGGGVDDAVYALAVDSASGELYAGGRFQTAGGVPASHVARWDGEQWHALGSGIGSSGFEYVTALALDPATGDLYVGGLFEEAGGVTVNEVARWDGEHWHALDEGVLGLVFALLVESGGDLLVGGAIERASGVPVDNVARWDGEQWSAMGDPNLLEVRALAEQPDGTVLAGGFLDNTDDPLVAAWDRKQEAWTPLLSDVYAGEDCWFIVTSIVASEEHLYVGSGEMVCFPEGDPVFTNSLLEQRGEVWEPLGSGLFGLAYSLTLIGDDLYVGGSFTEAGGRPARNFARWNETLILSGVEDAGPEGEEAAGLRARVAPNPSRGHAQLHLDLDAAAHLTLQTYSVLGRLVDERSAGAQPAGAHAIPLPMDGLSAGTYLLRVIAEVEGEKQVVRLIMAKL